MLTFTFAGDEAGDVSFAFTKGASRNFVVSVIATSEPENLRTVLETVRKDANLSKTYEFGFNSVSSVRLCERVFTALGNAESEAGALIVDKTTLPDTFKLFMSGLDVYVYFVSELIRQIPTEKRAHATLILDEFCDSTQTGVEGFSPGDSGGAAIVNLGSFNPLNRGRGIQSATTTRKATTSDCSFNPLNRGRWIQSKSSQSAGSVGAARFQSP
jgi:hypothetical protein